MSDQKLCMVIALPLSALILTGMMASSFYCIVPFQHTGIWTTYGHIKYNKTFPPGFYFKSPLVKVVNMFVGWDKDTVSYTCETIDAIKFKGKVAITNQLQAEHALESYRIHGENPDGPNIYDMAEFYMQSRCATMTAVNFGWVDFTKLDDWLFEDMVKAQIASKSGLKIDKDKVKVFKAEPTNSDIATIKKKEAEHRQSTKTADEEQKLNVKLAALASSKQKAEEELARERNIAKQQRLTDSQETDLERQKRLIEAKKERQLIQNEVERGIALKDANVTLIHAQAAAKAVEIKAASKAKAKEMDAEANIKFLTPELLAREQIQAIHNNTKIIMGNRVPTNSFMPLKFTDE